MDRKLLAIASVIAVSTTHVGGLLIHTSNSVIPLGRHFPRVFRPNLRLALSQTHSCEDRIKFDKGRERQLVIFRPPSRHTYGFVGDPDDYDLPRLELGELIRGFCDHTDFQFIPVVDDLNLTTSLSGQKQNVCAVESDNRKARLQVQKSSRRVQSIYWIEGDVPKSYVAEAASRAILTHATFLINETFCFTEDEWNNSGIQMSDSASFLKCQGLLDGQIDVIDMTNPNMSLKERKSLLQRISFLLCEHELQSKGDSILIHHVYLSLEQPIHCIHVGKRTAIGPAGTQGAPSQTLRRTHRGILKKYALNKRSYVNSGDNGKFARSNISTAMEPEIGFLMANLALATANQCEGKSISVLDPCCGSGSLLLYSAVLGATSLVGVDSDPNVWTGANLEFKRHQIACPTFVEGDVFRPHVTKELSTPSTFDAIICDPPYNIGAPVFVNKQDLRSKNYHQYSQLEQISGNGDSAELCNSNSSEDIILCILRLAGCVLIDGGRIVFFLPVKGNQKQSAVNGYESIIQAEGLSLVFERRQHFSNTFSRWLVCLEKV